MQRPVHPSYGRVNSNVDGCLFVWTSNGRVNFIFFKFLLNVSRCPVRRTAQSPLHVMLLSLCVFHEYDRQNFDPA